MAGNFAEFGPEESGARLAEQDYAKDISNTMQNLVRFSQVQEADAKLPLIRAEARKTGAEADVLERKVAVQKRMADLMAGRPPSGGSGNLAYDMADVAGAAGDVDTATKYLVQGSQVEANRARAGVSMIDQEMKELDTLRRSAQMVGSMAAGVVDQTSYDRFLAQAQNSRLNVGSLPPDYESAKAGLSQLTAQGMSVKDWVDTQIKERLEKGKEATDAALLRSRNASAAASSARADLIRQRLDDARKNGGERSAEALEYRKELTKLTKARREAMDMKAPTPIPQDKTKREQDRVYLGSDGKTKVVWDKKPDGTMGQRVITPAEEGRLSKMAGSVMGAIKSLGSDNDDDVLGPDADEDSDD